MAADTEKFDAMVKTLANADRLVTMVIKGEPGLSRAALDLARDIYDLKRKHGIKFPTDK
jgi:hypothetical protein